MRLWPHSPERRCGGTLGNAGQEGPAGRRAASTAARRWGGTAGRTADIGVIIGLSCNLQDHIKEALMYLNTLLTMV